MPPRYVLIANPGSKRCETYHRELAAFWSARGHTPDVTVAPWADVIPADGNLDGLPAFDRPAVVRLESPGKDDHVTRLLLDAGARDDPREPRRDWRDVHLPKGLLVRPGLLHRGFARVLRGLRRSFDARPHLNPNACPLAVARMFDKAETGRILTAAGVFVPEILPADLDRPDAVYDAIAARGWPTGYLKLSGGSSAVGMIALTAARPGRPGSGVTGLAAKGDEFYNSRRLRRLTGPDLDRAVGFVLGEGAIVQRGVPLARADGQNFDVRIICVYGRPVGAVFRVSPHPMTNLQLGGRRGNPAAIRSLIPPRAWLDAVDACESAAGCFASAVAGVDLMFEPGFRRHWVLEVNAFGDFFPGWTDDQGRSAHAIEIAATVERSGPDRQPIDRWNTDRVVG